MERSSSDNIGDNLPALLEGLNISDHLLEIRLPCFVTVGNYDPATQKCARAIHRGDRGSKFVMFEKCFRTVLWENRVHFMEVVRNFPNGVTVPK